VLRRSLPLAAVVVAALLFIMNQGYWSHRSRPCRWVIVAAAGLTAIGVPSDRRGNTGAAVRSNWTSAPI